MNRLKTAGWTVILSSINFSCGGAAPSADTTSSLDPGLSAAGRKPQSSCAASGGICLGLRYVSYVDGSGKAVSSESLARSNLAAINSVWKQCGIQFQLENFESVDPLTLGLAFGSGAEAQTYDIRQKLGENDQLLVVVTGAWPGSTKQAWTAPPGDQSYGAIIEGGSANYPMIIAHELGHYLGLDHIADSPAQRPENLMNWMIYTTSNQLTADQCHLARTTAQSYWQKMLR